MRETIWQWRERERERERGEGKRNGRVIKKKINIDVD